MNLRSLREALWWAVDDGSNPHDLEMLAVNIDVQLINEALLDTASCLRIIRHSNTLTPDTNGLVVLPADVLEIERVCWGGADLKPLNSVQQISVGDASGEVTDYMFVGRDKLQLYATPLVPFRVLDVWYKAYPAPLVNDGDVPTEIPLEFRLPLATIYARARFLEKVGGDKRVMQHLLGAWFMYKKQLQGEVEARQRPVIFKDSWSW